MVGADAAHGTRSAEAASTSLLEFPTGGIFPVFLFIRITVSFHSFVGRGALASKEPEFNKNLGYSTGNF